MTKYRIRDERIGGMDVWLEYDDNDDINLMVSDGDIENYVLTLGSDGVITLADGVEENLCRLDKSGHITVVKG